MPDNAITLYESLRTQVLKGAERPQGLSVMLYHGMLRGLQILAANTPSASQPIPLDEKKKLSLCPIPLDAQLVSLLANMISHLQPELKHVY